MKSEIVMPKFGWTMEEGLISAWLKEVGDAVTEGEPLFVIETDKANQEVEAQATGTLEEILYPAGSRAAVGEVIGYIAEGQAAPKTASGGSTSAAEQAKPAAPPAPALRAAQVIPLAGLRRAIADQMSLSLRQAAQLTLTSEVDLTATAGKRKADVSHTAILIQAAGRTLGRHPLLNSTLSNGEITVWEQRNIGFAVSLPSGGLVVAVVREADKKDVVQITAEVRQLSEQARAGSLPASALADGTFTVTSLGAYGIDAFTPILNPPQTAILGVGRWVEKPAFVNGEIAARVFCTLSLSFDHRVIDGVPAAEFLKDLSELLNKGDFL